MGTRKLFGLLLVAGATLRATRLVVVDDLGRWWFRDPARKWANSHESEGPPDPAYVEPDNGWRSKLVSGLECPFCAGFWIAGLVLLSYRLFGHTTLWKFVAGWFTLNHLTAHLGARLGDVNDDE